MHISQTALFHFSTVVDPKPYMIEKNTLMYPSDPLHFEGCDAWNSPHIFQTNCLSLSHFPAWPATFTTQKYFGCCFSECYRRKKNKTMLCPSGYLLDLNTQGGWLFSFVVVLKAMPCPACVLPLPRKTWVWFIVSIDGWVMPSPWVRPPSWGHERSQVEHVAFLQIS